MPLAVTGGLGYASPINQSTCHSVFESSPALEGQFWVCVYHKVINVMGGSEEAAGAPLSSTRAQAWGGGAQGLARVTPSRER